MIMHDDDVVVLLPPALRVPPAETRLTVYRRPHILGEGARDPFVGRTFSFQTVVRAKTAQNLNMTRRGGVCTVGATFPSKINSRGKGGGR